MADRRLVWNQIAAPDLSGASAAIARANQSFTRGIQAGSDALGAYGTAQQEQNDNELLGEIAGLNSEDQLDAFLTNTDFNSRNISSGLRDTILGRRDEIIGYNQGRADVRGTNARTAATSANTAIAQATEGRNASEYAYGVRRRDELTGLSGAIVGANREGNQYGRDGTTATNNTRLMLARTLQAEAGNEGVQGMVNVGSVIRNRAASGRYGEGIEGVIMRPGQFSAWNSVTGYADGKQGQNMDFQPSEEALAAADAVLSGNYEDQTGGATHYVNYNVSKPSWFNDGFQRRGNHWFGNGDGGDAVHGNTGAIDGYSGPAQPAQRPQFDALAAALAGSSTLTPSDISGLLSGAYQAQEIGQGRIDSASAEAERARADAAVLGAFTDPSVSADPNSQLAAAQAAGLDAGGTLDLLGRIQGAASANPGIFSPEAPVDPLSQAATAAAAEERERSTLIQQRQTRDIEDITENPVGSLTTMTGINDPEVGDGSFSERDMTARIDQIAEAHNITRGEAAYAMANTFVQDPGQGIPGWDLTRNTLNNHFPDEEIARFVSENLGADARTRSRDVGTANSVAAAEAENSQARLATLQGQALRYQSAGQAVPEEIAREITGIQDNLRAGTTPEATALQLETYLSRTGTASRLQGLDPESPEFFRAVADLETQIQGDRTLDADEKRLLLSALRG